MKVTSLQVAASGCDLANSVAQSIANSTIQAVLWDTENEDTDNYHSTSSNTSRIVIPAGMDGKYLFTANIAFETNVTGIRFVWFVKNGVTAQRYSLASSPAVSGDVSSYCIARPFRLVAGDYLEVYVFQNSGGALNIRGESSNVGMAGFTATRMGA